MTNEFDKIQAQEWVDSVDNLLKYETLDQANYIINTAIRHFSDKTGVSLGNSSGKLHTDYTNTIPLSKQPIYPGNIEIEKRISAFIRWNAMAIVVRANKESSELGGHISSYASSAFLYDVGFNHFWKAPNEKSHGDMIFFQGHISPGIYARSFVEGRFAEEQLLRFRQESDVNNPGLSSYPHPWLMPDYWQFPTVSMGLGPLMAIFQARFMHYLHDRNITNTEGRKVWCFIGDGETSEPETLGNIHLASREALDNLIFVVNCNLQRLDGPVNGNGKIIQELEGLFHGAGWKVIKVIWGHGWDKLLAKDASGKLRQLMMESVDGAYQDYKSKNGAYVRKQFFGRYPETQALVADMTDEQIWNLTRGGHDLEKVYAAYHEAVNKPEGKPVVLLIKTIKGFGMGDEGESQNIAHNQKKLTTDTLKKIRTRFHIPLSDEDVENVPFIKFAEDSIEHKYLHERRDKLGGYYPIRKPTTESLIIPSLDAFEPLLKSTDEREMSTTMAFVRVLNILVKDKNIGNRIVPIVPDESRTFGMEGMFRQLGIWSHVGQLYTPEDAAQLMYYKESTTGQIFQEGINEAGAMSTWIAAATSYANHNAPMLPFYIYYSMFGFQRIGDLAWAAGDMRARGFMVGGTAGRTTLNGEGLQHEDGQSHIQAGLIPNCESYDPTFSYEVAVIIRHGLQEMYIEQKDKFYYLTVMNENYAHPKMPVNSESGIIAGAYLFKTTKSTSKLNVNLLGSGTILREVIEAAELLNKDFGISSNIFSATSFNKLARDGRNSTRFNMLNPSKKRKEIYITKLLGKTANLTVAATDYVRAYPESIREYVSSKYVTLGTDGFGRSDYRKNLRNFFEVNRYYIVLATLNGLSEQGLIDNKTVMKAISLYNIDTNKANPWEI